MKETKRLIHWCENRSKWQEYFIANRTDADDIEYAPYEITSFQKHTVGT